MTMFVLVLVGPLLIVGWLMLQLTGVIPTGQSNVVAHLAGFGWGAIAGVLIPGRWMKCDTHVDVEG